MQRLWIRNGLVYTGGDEPRVLVGGLLCAGANVDRVGADAELAEAARGAREIDAGGRLIAPGWINAHMHLYATLARGMPLNGPPPEDFVQVLERLWWRLDKALTLEDLAPSAELALIDALRAGVTSVIDHHASPNAIDGSLDALAEAARRVGVRLSACYEVSDRDGAAAMRAGIAENMRFAKRAERDPMLCGMFGLHASFTLSADSLQACAAAAREAGLACHVHTAESAADAADARARGFSGPLDRLVRSGAITPGSLAVHCVHTSEQEWELLNEAGAFAIHSPQSNMNNAVGALPLGRLLAAGVKVGLGTDGMQADVREEARAAFLLGRHESGDPRTMWAETAHLLDTNREIASGLFGLRLGELCPGAAADVVVYEYLPPTPLGRESYLGHLLFGLYRAGAHTVVVAGRIRLREGQPLFVDPAEAAARARERAERLWARI